MRSQDLYPWEFQSKKKAILMLKHFLFQKEFKQQLCLSSNQEFLLCKISNLFYLNCMTPSQKKLWMLFQFFTTQLKAMQLSSSSNLLKAVAYAKVRRKMNTTKLGNGVLFIWIDMSYRSLNSRFHGLIDSHFRKMLRLR